MTVVGRLVKTRVHSLSSAPLYRLSNYGNCPVEKYKKIEKRLTAIAMIFPEFKGLFEQYRFGSNNSRQSTKNRSWSLSDPAKTFLVIPIHVYVCP